MQTVETELSQRLIEPLTRRERQMLVLLAEGFSRPEIAARLTMGLGSVKTHLHHVYGKLGVSTKRQALDRAQALGLLATTPGARGDRLPMPAWPTPLTPLLGREQEIAQLHQLLRRKEIRLITITGPGGVGKTSLGVHVVREAQAAFADGSFLVNLAPVSDPTLILPTIAQALSVPKSPRRLWLDNLKDYLRDQQVLLLLDNFEQLVDRRAAPDRAVVGLRRAAVAGHQPRGAAACAASRSFCVAAGAARPARVGNAAASTPALRCSWRAPRPVQLIFA